MLVHRCSLSRDWEIALIVIGCLLIILLIIAGIVLCFCFRLLCFSGNKKIIIGQDKIIPSNNSSNGSVKRPKPIIHYVDIDDVDKKASEPDISIKGYSHSPKFRRYEELIDINRDNVGGHSTDDVRHYAEEGGGSVAGSLSSIVSSEDSETDTHISNIMARMGDRFKVLAKLYTEESSSDSDTTSSDSTIVPGPGSESWV